MKNLILLISTIEKIIGLLTSVGEVNWRDAFCQFRQHCDNLDEEKLALLRAEVLKIFGGVGSFNDLVLYVQGRPLVKENQRLGKLRKELFQVLTDR